MPHVPSPRSSHGAGPVPVAGQQRHEELAQGQQGRLREHADEAQTRVVLEHGTQLVAPLQHLQRDRVSPAPLPGQVERLQPAGHRFAVTDPGLRRHHDPRPGHLAAPREVEVLAHGDDPGVKAFQLAKQVGPDQDAPARGDEDVTHRIVLAVVHLTLENAVDHGSGLVATHAHVEQNPRVVPVDEFGGDDSGVGTEGLLDQLADGVMVGRHVVVAEQEEGRPFHHLEGLVGRGAVPGPSRQVAHEGVGEDPAHPLGDLVRLGPVGEHQDGKFVVVLGGQGRKRLFEPRTRLGGDHDGDHGRHLGVHQGAEAIRSAQNPSGTESGS